MLFVVETLLHILGLMACQKSITEPSVSAVLVNGSPSCDIRQRIRELTNPQGLANTNEQAFYDLVQREGINSNTSEIERIRPSLEVWTTKIRSMVCHRAQKASCHLALIPKNLQKALVSIQYAKYAHTLKVREVDGNQVIFVKGSGFRPERDPKQPDGVKERYQNHYLWYFREMAGDLHPGFLWGALLNKDPTYLDSHCAEGTKYCRDTNFNNIIKLWREILRRGYLSELKRGLYEETTIQDLYLVQPHKAASFKVDKDLERLSVDLFGSEKGSVLMSKINQFIAKRKSPILRANHNGKFEITEANMKQMNLEVPAVSLEGWSVYLVDHHRISAAHDLGMAIEVIAYHGYLSLN